MVVKKEHFVNIVLSYRYMQQYLIRFSTTAQKTPVPCCLNYFHLHENICVLKKTMSKVCVILIRGWRNEPKEQNKMNNFVVRQTVSDTIEHVASEAAQLM